MPTPSFNFASSFEQIHVAPFGSKVSVNEIAEKFNDIANGLARHQKEMNWFMSYLSSENALEFGGYYVTNDQLASKNGQVGLSSAVTGGSDIRIWAGDQLDGVPPFRVYEDGKMIASNAEITGKVTANSGAIGGWVIGNTTISDTSGLVGMSSAVTTGDDVRFFAGNIAAGSAPFRVYESGGVYASNITVAGGSISVSSNVTIGDKLILSSTNFGNGIRWGSTSMQVYIDPGSQAMFLSAPGGVYANGSNFLSRISSLEARVSALGG